MLYISFITVIAVFLVYKMKCSNWWILPLVPGLMIGGAVFKGLIHIMWFLAPVILLAIVGYLLYVKHEKETYGKGH